MDGGILVVGLGNPGESYSGNRHNVGFMLLDRLSRRFGIPVRSRGHHSRFGEGWVDGRLVVLAKPQTFMNRSGRSVAALLGNYRLELPDLLVLHDDLDMDAGRVRVKEGGGHGGHNGLRSLLEVLGTGDFRRVKVGIGRPPAGGDPAEYVLRDFDRQERPLIEEALERAEAEAVAIISRRTTVPGEQL